MMTFVATFKPFAGVNGIQQLNALKSWLRFCPPCEVLIIGDEIKSSGFIHNVVGDHVRMVEDVRRNRYGTPLLSSILEIANSYSTHEHIGLINGDIILLSDPIATIKLVRQKFQKFLIYSRRYEACISTPIDFNNPGALSFLQSFVRNQDPRKRVFPVDIFIFPKSLLNVVPPPPLAYGRGMWARWLIYMAYRANSPVIDASEKLLNLHQVHDYSHAVHANEPPDWSGLKRGEEYRENVRLIGMAAYFSDKDSTHVIRGGEIVYDANLTRLVRRGVKRAVLNKAILDLSRSVIPARVRRRMKRSLRSMGLLY